MAVNTAFLTLTRIMLDAHDLKQRPGSESNRHRHLCKRSRLAIRATRPLVSSHPSNIAIKMLEVHPLYHLNSLRFSNAVLGHYRLFEHCGAVEKNLTTKGTKEHEGNRSRHGDAKSRRSRVSRNPHFWQTRPEVEHPVLHLSTK